jgi:hypothetical protein
MCGKMTISKTTKIGAAALTAINVMATEHFIKTGSHAAANISVVSAGIIAGAITLRLAADLEENKSLITTGFKGAVVFSGILGLDMLAVHLLRH